ncbi:MAG: 2-C-methyl-D-erythritol 4-phosphate cytidylyltransferase [Eubacteriaceae bacterium]
MERLFTSVIIPAAGQGRRMNAPINKQYLTIQGKPILAYTLDVFENCPLIDEIILVINIDEIKVCKQQVLKPNGYKKVTLVEGGDTRQKSVYEGLRSVDAKAEIVMIHDGARPIIHEDIIVKSIFETKEHKATVVGVPAKNTIKVIKGKGFVDYTPNRDLLVEIQTPQTFTYDLLKQAHEKAIEEGVEGTDDAFLVERICHPVKIVHGHYNNIKITTPEDLIIAESIINRFGRGQINPKKK